MSRYPVTPDRALRDRRVVVTGAAGFIGANLVHRLVGIGCDVAAVVRPGGDLTRISDVLDRVAVIEADVSQLGTSEASECLSGADLVFHLACAGVSPDDCDQIGIVDTNVKGTLRVLQAAGALGCERFIYCGSCFEYGHGSRLPEDAPLVPLTEYGASKAAGWLLAQTFSRRYGLPVVGLRPFTVYGPYEAPGRLVPYVTRAALTGAPIALTAGSQQRDFVYVADAVEGFLAAAVAPTAPGETFNLCTGEPRAVSEVVAVILQGLNSSDTPQLGALERRATDMPVLSGDPAKAASGLGWTAQTSLGDGLAQTIEWHREQLATAVWG